MLKLMIVAGPNRGASYNLQDGDTTVGRSADNVIVLPSSKVSKRHCLLQVADGSVVVVDQGSSNGTFVNGTLAKSKPVNPGDRISVGDCVLQVVKPAAPAARRPAQAGGGNVIAFPGQQMPMPGGAMGGLPGMPGMESAGGGFGGAMPGMGGTSVGGESAPDDFEPVPTDLKGKLAWAFEKFVMPVFYNLSFSHDWRIIGGAMFALFTVITLVLSIYPLIEASNNTVLVETSRRARFMARQIVEMNTAAIASKAESKADIGSMEREPGVIAAVLTDLNNRIIAPASKSNQYLASGPVATKSVEAAKAFQNGAETGGVGVSGSVVIAVEPVKVFSPRSGRNVVTAMAVVALDTSISTPDLGTIGVIYSKSLVITGLIGAFVLLVLYRMTLKPFEVLNEDIDKVLRGDLGQITREFKFEELKSLWEVIDSALQRLPKDGSSADAANTMTAEDFSSPARMLSELAKNVGIVLCDEDRRVLFANAAFEDVTGIRGHESAGQELTAVARDQAFAALVGDLCSAVQMGGASSAEDFDFSGIAYRVHVSSFGTGSAKGYLFALVRSEQG